MTLPTYSIAVTDLAGVAHTITDDVQDLETTTVLSDATDTFSFTIDNTNDAYSYIEKGCNVIVETGISHLRDRVDGYIIDVTKTLDSSGTVPTIRVSGEDSGIRLNNIYFSGRFYDKEVSALVHAIMSSSDFSTGKTYYELADIINSSAKLETTPHTISEASYNFKSVGSVIKELAELVGYEWYIMPFAGFRILYFFDPAGEAILGTIVDSDLEGVPNISTVGDIINRAIVMGGYQQNTDKSGGSQTTTTIVTSTTAKNQSFVPTEDYLSSVLVYTELVSGSESSITISIQADSSSAPDGVTLANAHQTVNAEDIADEDYTEFRFSSDVTLTPADTYWIVMEGTDSNGVKVGINGSAVLDYITRYPVRVAVMANDLPSQTKYGIYSTVYWDSMIEDSQYAETKANELLVPEPKESARLTLRDDSYKAGEVLRLNLSTVGVAIDKIMKIRSSTQTVGDVFIYNTLEMEEV